jgi:hypothetical protein
LIGSGQGDDGDEAVYEGVTRELAVGPTYT